VWHGARSLPRRRVGVSSGAPYQPRRDPPRQVAHHRALLLDRPLNERVQLQLAIDLCHGTRETRRARSYLDTRHLRERSPPPRSADRDGEMRIVSTDVTFRESSSLTNLSYQTRDFKIVHEWRTAEGGGKTVSRRDSFKFAYLAPRPFVGSSAEFLETLFRGGTKGEGSFSRVEEIIRIVMRLVLIL